MHLRLSLSHAVSGMLEGIAFRGKGRLLERLCPASGEATRILFGRPVSLDLADHIQRWIFLGLYEAGPTAAVRNYLRPGMIVADVGANVGYYTLLAVSCIGTSGRVIAFEPAERPRRRLISSLSGLQNVSIVDCALGAVPGVASIYIDRDADNDTPTMVPSEGGVAVPVRVTRLDDSMDEFGVDHLDLLKLDVEGWEPHILDGASRLLARGAIGAILCELNDYWLTRTGTSARGLYHRLLGLGFRDTTPTLPLADFETRLFVHESS
jgi:FkbM family methyltransferase